MAMHQQQQVKSFKLGTFSYVKKNKTNSSSPKDVLRENRGEKKLWILGYPKTSKVTQPCSSSYNVVRMTYKKY